MKLPSARELNNREDLVPKTDLADRLAEAIAATEKFKRKSVVTITYNVDWDEEQEKLSLRAAVKAKRPVKPNRNEEVLGEVETIFVIANQVAGQQRLPDADEN